MVDRHSTAWLSLFYVYSPYDQHGTGKEPFRPLSPLERSVRGFTHSAMLSTCRHGLENSGKTGFMRVNWRGFDVHGGGPCTQCAQARELPTDYFGDTNNRTYDFMDEWRRKPGHFLP